MVPLFAPSPPRLLHLLPLLGLLAACGRPAATPEDAELIDPPISRAELLGAEYPTDLVASGRIRLENGMFRAAADEGGGEEVGAQLVEPVAFGTLGDGRAVAAVVLVMSGGGSGTFSWLYLAGREGAGARVLADAFLGDRVELSGLSLAGDTVLVKLVTQGPEDPLCCPTMVVERRYVFRDGGLQGEPGTGNREPGAGTTN